MAPRHHIARGFCGSNFARLTSRFSGLARSAALISVLTLALGACANTRYLPDAPLGSLSRPVLTDSPRGELEYLHRLRCSNGGRPEFVRGGSTAPSRDGHILDGYLIRCGSSELEAFFDMYHPQARATEPLLGPGGCRAQKMATPAEELRAARIFLNQREAENNWSGTTANWRCATIRQAN